MSQSSDLDPSSTLPPEYEPKSHKDYTIGWICALSIELTAARVMLDVEHPTLPKPSNDASNYILGSIGYHNIVISCLPKGIIGTNQAAVIATRMVNTFPSIKLGLMVGIGGGIPPKVKLGDVVVSVPKGKDPGVVQWDMGKAESDGKFQRTGALDKPPMVLLTTLSILSSDHDMQGITFPSRLQGAGGEANRSTETKIDKTENVEVHFGLIASGNKVIKDANVRDSIDQNLGGNVLLEKEDDRKVLEWLTPMEYGPVHNDIVQRRQSGTGKWFLGSEEFTNWLQGSREILFCPGIPGAGKTFLTSVVIDQLSRLFGKTPAVGIAWIYFNYTLKSEQTTYNILANVLKQLVRRQRSLPEELKQLYEENKNNIGMRPSVDQICKALKSVVTLYSRVFVVVDALDECQMQSPDYCRGKLISTIFDLHAECGVNILATSRHIKEIVEQFTEQGSTTLEVRADDEDLRMYLDGRIDQTKRKMLREHRGAIKDEIVKAVQGMFLLARLHFESVENKTTPKKLKTALGKLSTGEEGEAAYGIAYTEAMERIDSQNSDFKNLARRVLVWVVCAERPLDQLELQHALAVEPEASQDTIDDDDLTDINDIISVCAGLVTIDEDTKIVRLIHYTTQEYFDKQEWTRHAQTGLAEICIIHLSIEMNSADPLGTADSNPDEYTNGDSNMSSGPFCSYAMRNWGYHANKCSPRIALGSEVEKCPKRATNEIIFAFLRNKDIITRTYGGKGERFKSVDFDLRISRQLMGAAGIHLVGHFGLWEYIDQLLFEGTDIEAANFEGQTPLMVAAENGDLTTVECLLRNGANPEARDTERQTALILSATMGHDTVVNTLLREGASPHVEDIDGETALLRAAHGGHSAVVEALLGWDAGWALNRTDLSDRTPLRTAVGRGSIEIVKMLIREGANIEAKNRYGETALSEAIAREHAAVVEFLLGKGANLETENEFGRTPLMLAAELGRERIVDILLRGGADPTAKDHENRASISYAAFGGCLQFVERLLRQGVNIDTQEDEGRTPLWFAVTNGCDDVVELLLREGANVEIRGEGKTPLMAGAEGGVSSTIEILLKRGVNMEAKDDMGRTALSYAAQKGSIACVELLLRHGANLESKDNNGLTPLSWAVWAYGSTETILEFLVREGADLETKDNAGRTPFSRAAEEDIYVAPQKPLTMILLRLGADLESKDHTGRTPLSWAVGHGEYVGTTVEFLLSKGANPYSEDDNGKTPLSWARENQRGSMNIIEESLASRGRVGWFT
ncbi:hypothetical protein TWF173_001426 [Orbilia oligospora]|nr:hypothetical protein TWF173_001426 [Orbilia oligospora]